MTSPSFFRACALLAAALAGCVSVPNEPRPERTGAAAPPASALDSQLAGLDLQIEGRRGYNEKLREWIAERSAQLAVILATDRAARPTVQEFELRSAVQAKLREADRAARAWAETLNAHRAVLKGAASDSRNSELAQALTRFHEQREDLLHLRAQLAAFNDKLSR